MQKDILYPREIIKKIKPYLERDEFIIITGARQTGKTSILFLLKEILEDKNNSCYYFNLENPEYLFKFNEHPFKLFDFLPAASHKGKQYIFIDEIQYLSNPTNFLKLLHDERRRQVKLIVSGSSAFYMDNKFKDSLAGRKLLFEVYPLNFNEFLEFNDEGALLNIHHNRSKLQPYYRKRLISLWNKYICYGGYPKVVLAENEQMAKIFIEEIGTSYIKKDIVEAGIKNTEKYFFLLKTLAEQTGGLVNTQELSNTLGIAHKTVEEYLSVMRRSYQMALIRPFYGNIRKELTKMPKIYFYDNGLRNFFVNNFSVTEKRRDKGAFLENLVFGELVKLKGSSEKIRFWRTQDGKEVDFVCDKKAYEVKSNVSKVKKNKYEIFRQLYPDIEFQFIEEEHILKNFYSWKT